ncbi:MAG: hypothetical protein HY243_12315 [Proteobacteria bacterium]|nr:hypothetical protein [Pseudomonadota bacterium]
MAALTADRNTPRRDGFDRVFPVAAATKIFGGAIVALNAAGNAVPGQTALALAAVGRCEQSVDNSAGAAGDQTAQVTRGIFLFDNSAGGDAITLSAVGSPCYMVDDHTVALTSGIVAGAGTRSAAGTVFDVDASGVWVKF